jgi:hypothetical protein
MTHEQKLEVIEQGNKLYKQLSQRNIHLDQPNALVDNNLTKNLIQRYTELSQKIDFILTPTCKEDIFINELKRMSDGTVSLLTENISETLATPEQVMQKLNITEADVELVKKWLIDNRETIISANKNQYINHSEHEWGSVHIGIPQIRDSAEKLVGRYLDVMKNIMREMTDTFPLLDKLVDEYIISFDSFERRASSNIRERLGYVCTQSVTRMYKGKVYLLMENFLASFVHEVIGHCYNYIMTEHCDLPLYIKDNHSVINSATRESVAMYMEDKFVDLLISNPKWCAQLSEDEPFEKAYKRYRDTKILDQYGIKLYQLGVYVLATTTMDESQKQFEELKKYSIEPGWSSHFVNRNKNNWDKTTKRLVPKLVAELRYAVNPIEKNNWDIREKEMGDYYKALLTGFWTPLGFEEWVNFNLNIVSSK